MTMVPEDVIQAYCLEHSIECEKVENSVLLVSLKGEQKLNITVAIGIGTYAITVNVFVMRKPDENQDLINKILLEQNLKIFGLGYAINHLGDIYLVGKLPLSCSYEDIDRIFGAVIRFADDAFNRLVELGFTSAIRREWAWRVSRGESLDNLKAFSHLMQS